MRVAFTIILNGLRHLKQDNYTQFMTTQFDHWVIVEGVSRPTGSTSWCKELSTDFHKNYLSNDGTTEFLDTIKSDRVTIVRCKDKPWENKDEQVNAAIDIIKSITNECMLWQVDIDEKWTSNQLQEAEEMLRKNNGKTGCFLCNYYVGEKQIALGDWGEGKHEPYRRLWDWKGEKFVSHEPPKLKGKNGPGLLLPQRFNHFAYYYKEDVMFKEAYYGSYEGLYNRWLKVQDNISTIHIRELLGPKVWWSNTNTIIKYTDDSRRQ